MSTSETKIELVIEAVENLSLAIAQGMVNAGMQHMPPSATVAQNIIDARKQVHDALAELLRPTLRIVENVPYGGEGIEGMDL